MVNSQLNESNSTESASQSHRGTGSVTPPPKSDVYSQEDSDGIGEVPNGYLDPIKVTGDGQCVSEENCQFSRDRCLASAIAFLLASDYFMATQV